jgi:Tfp pilus assembly protein PilO
MLALVAVTRTRLRDERGALSTTELLGLILIVLAVLAVVGTGINAYIQGKLAALH